MKGSPSTFRRRPFATWPTPKACAPQLILQGLAAATARVDLNSGAWYRVTVGPIESATEAKSVMNNLREQKLDAIWIKRS